VITSRSTRLVRVPDLQGFHRAIAESVGAPPDGRTAVITPTTAAADALQRTLQSKSHESGRAEIVTRDDFYARMHEALPDRPTVLSAFEREVLLIKAADAAAIGGDAAPFRLRPGLVAEILAFYDELRRRDRTVDDFDRLMTESLIGSVDVDRGAERLFRQTRFLASAFRHLERLVEASGGVDEHGLRAAILRSDRSAFARVVVTVADQAADPRGLWTVDFDLLARVPGLQQLDVIATENVLAAGFHQRIHDLLPGIAEDKRGTPSTGPTLITTGDEHRRWFVCRDREEELTLVARRAAASGAAERMAVVIQRPLPYLYLARFVFAAARQPYQAQDTLPLAAEPFAAALDVVFAFLIAEGNRASTIDLLASPHWRFPSLDGTEMSIRERVGALDVLLRDIKYLGGWDRLSALARHAAQAKRRTSKRVSPAEAIEAAITAGEALRPVREATTASAQIRALLDFVATHERVPDGDDNQSARHRRARAAVLDALASLAAAHQRHDDSALTIERLYGAVRRWIDGQTFAPSTGSRGVALVDAPAAAYADVDELHIVGLVETDWPERARRSIFYPSSLLSQLGWPNELDRLVAARARFQDLLRLPRIHVSASTFTLEDDAIVSASSFLEELDASGLAIETRELDHSRSVFVHEWILDGDVDDESKNAPIDPGSEAADWLALRRSRTTADDAAFRGSAGVREPSVYAVSHVERYLECPFKYFSARVLELDEEREHESGLSPQERGQLLHEVFEAFFREWNARGGKTITADNLKEALELFEEVADATLAKLPEADRALERTYLLGSAAAAGLGERAFNVEIEQETEVVERLLEHPLEGAFRFRGEQGVKEISIRAKADRIDLLEDGTLRVIDYKLGRAPKPARALQLPIYGVCAEQHLKGRRGREWRVSRAGYVAFKEKNAFVGLAGPSVAIEDAMQQGEQRLVGAVTAIERGEFPVKPDEPYRCRWCGYAGVCRKDYIGDE
jgi:RecB family exonuclease